MLELPDLALSTGIAAAGAVAVWAVLERLYVAIPPNRALVLYGRRAGRAPDGAQASAREPRILVGGGTYVAPWNHALAYLSLAPIDVESTVRALHALDGGSAEGWEVALRVQVKVPAEPRALRTAAENLLGLGEEELRSYARRAIEGAVPAVLARLRPADGEPEWEHLASEIHAAVAPDLVASGLVVRSVAVTELRRISPTSRTERPPPPRGRSGWAAATEAGGRREDSEPRLARVEHGIRAIAAALARLLRDEPEPPAGNERWAEPPAPDRPDLRSHDSIADGRPPAAARPPWGAAPDAEAEP